MKMNHVFRLIYSERNGDPFVSSEALAESRNAINYISRLTPFARNERFFLFIFFLIFTSNISAMLGEGSFVGTGGYAIGGTPYYYAGLSYYYDPQMDYKWDGQQWISQTGAQWPARCCKPNPCSACGYRQVRECTNECSACTIEECVNNYKNLTRKGY